LPLADPYSAQAIRRKGSQLLRCFHQPLQHRLGLNLEPPRGAPDTSTLGQTREDAHAALHGATLAMHERPMLLRNGALAGTTLAWSPGSTMGRPMRAEIAPSHPAAISATGMRTKGPRGIDRPWTSGGRRPGSRGHRRRRFGMCGVVFTRGARRFLSKTGKRFGVVGTLTPWQEGLGLGLPQG
jgi:hypothetical protein